VESAISFRRAAPLGLLVGALGCLLLFHKLFCADPATTLWADNFDARLLHWIAAWGYRAIVENGAPSDFWNAPSFFPHERSLAFSDSLLSAQLFYIPFRLAGLSAFSALYATLAATTLVACALSSWTLARIGGFSEVERALIIFVAHFGLPISGYLPHYQLFGFELAAPYFLFLYLFLRDWKGRDLMSLAGCFAFGACFATYLAPMLFTVTLVVASPSLWMHFRQNSLAATFRKIGVPSLLVALLLAAALYLFQLRPYVSLGKQFKPQNPFESVEYSARLNSLLTPAAGGHSYWYQPAGAPARFGDAERAFFPGVFVSYPMLCFFLLWAAKREGNFDGEKELSPGIDARLIQFMLLLLSASFILALGPQLGHWSAAKLPLWFLSWLIPGLEHVRAPGRFGIFTALPAIIFALALLRTLFRSHERKYFCAVFALLVVIESIPRYETYPFATDTDGIYAQVRKVLPQNSPLIELPVAGGDSLKTLLRTTGQLHGALIHRGKILTGYGASTTNEALELATLDLKLQRGKARPGDILKFGEKLGVHHYLVRTNRYQPAVRKRWLKYLQNNPQVEVLYQGSGVVVFEK
jgi:hypothetical protein